MLSFGMVKKHERKVIALVNLKGGVSKTTSSGYFAECLHEAGRTVTGVDTDPERGWTNWHQFCGMSYPLMQADSDSIIKMVQGIDGDIVIDTPPNDPLIITKVCMVADEVIIPVAGTGQDINRLARTLALVEDVEVMRKQPLHSVLLVQYHSVWKSDRESADVLHERKVAVLDQRIRDLARYVRFARPEYLDEHQAVLKELKVL